MSAINVMFPAPRATLFYTILKHPVAVVSNERTESPSNGLLGPTVASI